MSQRLVPLALAALLPALAPTVAAAMPAQPATPAPLATPQKVAPLRLPPITEQALSTGLAVVTVEKRDLPLVAIRLVVPTGAGRDPKKKDGIAALTGQLLRRGTAKRTADEIDDAIESIGGLLGIDVGVETTNFSVTVPAEHAAQALEVISDLVQHPSFPKKEFELARRRELAQLQQDLDDPSGVADSALVQFFYGKDHPYGHPAQGRTATVKGFKPEDVAKFHKATFTPAGSMLMFVGDIDPATAQRLAQAALGTWKGKALKPLAPTAPEQPNGLEILLVDKPDATQAQVRAVVPGIARKDPRFYAATAANTVIGGGFTSRLVDEIRVNRGLSYSVSTRVAALRDFGAVSYSTFTKSDTLRQLLDVSFAVLDKFRDGGPTQEELDKAKRYVIGLYPSRVESNEQLAESLASARFVGLPFDVIAKYRDELAAVTVERAAEAAKLYPSATNAKVVIVGNAAVIRPQLAGLGTLTVKKVEDYQ
jgi:zinc protease